MRLLLLVMLVGCETVQVRPAVETEPAPDRVVEADDEPAAGALGAVSLSVGPRSSCAVLEDGSLWCWGDGDDGLLGENPGPGPVRVHQAAGLSRVVVGQSRVCFLADEGVRCFGHFSSYHNSAGPLRTTPFAIPGLGGVNDLSVGVAHVCFVEADAAVRCIGHGAWTAGGRSLRLGERVVSGADSVAVGSGHSCALVEGEVLCWGNAWGGRFGGANVRSFSDSAHPVPELEGVRAISAYSTGAQTCALRDGDDIRCWGMTGHTAFGSSNASLGDSPVQLQPAGEPIARIVTGLIQVFAVAESGAVYRYLSQEPVAGEDVMMRAQTSYAEGVRLELPPISDIGVGLTHTCALTREGAVLCWGLGAGGRLGNGTSENLSTPTRVLFREASEE